MVKCIVVTSQKGGTGKTTVAVNLAAGAARQSNTRVGLLDLDPQGSLTDWSHNRSPESALAAITVKKGSHPINSEVIAAWASGFDVAVLDCPAQLGPTSRTAAALATTIVIPVEPSCLSLYSLTQTLKVVESAPARRVVVLSRAIRNLTVYRWAESTLLASRQKYGYEFAPRPIVHRPALYPEVAARGEAAVTLYPESHAAAEFLSLLDLALGRGQREPRTRTKSRTGAGGEAGRRRA
jgi:chromosome partitioning protein